ncbi:MAG: methionyl-tRNA formyltransferase, partial [Bacteroidota bacterium]
AFRMLPEVVWGMPPLGTFNLHASLLPQYRGAAPIQWAIMNGETETGVTTFFLQHAIDTGNIIAQKSLPIGPDDRADQVHDGLMALGANLVAETVDAIAEDRCSPTPQSDLAGPEAALKTAPKLFKEHGRLNWNRPVQELHNHIRGLSPYPGAWTELHSAERTVLLKVFRATFEHGETQVAPGSLVTSGRTALKVAGADGFIHLHEVQLAGKKRLPVADFLAGFQADAGWTAG